MRATVCLPTYNEHENLESMLRALGEHDVRVLVIDDNSPDGTGRLADRLAQELDYVDVLHRPRKEGLGPAYIAGFRRALADGVDRILEMDCDFSHDPKDVPRLIAATEEADLAIGSRYVGGGETVNWGTVRRAISAGGSLYARVLLSVAIRDLTAGFKCYRADVLRTIDLDAVVS
jgi:dolichol-phosphate mannosyltransferase